MKNQTYVKIALVIIAMLTLAPTSFSQDAVVINDDGTIAKNGVALNNAWDALLNKQVTNGEIAQAWKAKFAAKSNEIAAIKADAEAEIEKAKAEAKLVVEQAKKDKEESNAKATQATNEAIQQANTVLALMLQFKSRVEEAMTEEEKTGKGDRYNTYLRGHTLITELIAEAEKPLKRREADALAAEIAVKRAELEKKRAELQSSPN